MAKSWPPIVNIYEDHERWEESKFESFNNPYYRHDIEDKATTATATPESDTQLRDNPNHSKQHHRHRTTRDGENLEVRGRRHQGVEDPNRTMKPRRTLIRKEGQSNIAFRGIEKKKVRYLKDLYITLLDIKWRWAVFILFMGFFICYFTFSILYYFVSYAHGDFDHLHDPTFEPCIKNMESYWDALLFSIETQSTIGYGTIYPNAECGGTVPIVFTQITIGFLLETLLLGFIFVKIARPKHRRHTLVFSRNACLCLENGQMTLQVRLGDMRNTHLIDTHVYGVLVKRYVSEEKVVYPLFQHELEFQAHGMGDRVFLIWPMVLRHAITQDSPLFTLKPEDLLYDKFEIVVFLEGTIESTGEMVQARTSYTSKEILWGHRFTRIEEYDEHNDRWCMDFVRFNNVLPTKTPRCSAQQFDENPYAVIHSDESIKEPQISQSSDSANSDVESYSSASDENGVIVVETIS